MIIGIATSSRMALSAKQALTTSFLHYAEATMNTFNYKRSARSKEINGSSRSVAMIVVDLESGINGLLALLSLYFDIHFSPQLTMTSTLHD